MSVRKTSLFSQQQLKKLVNNYIGCFNIPLRCGVCQKPLKSATRLKQHMISVHKLADSCVWCNGQFKFKGKNDWKHVIECFIQAIYTLSSEKFHPIITKIYEEADKSMLPFERKNCFIEDKKSMKEAFQQTVEETNATVEESVVVEKNEKLGEAFQIEDNKLEILEEKKEEDMQLCKQSTENKEKLVQSLQNELKEKEELIIKMRNKYKEFKEKCKKKKNTLKQSTEKFVKDLKEKEMKERGKIIEKMENEFRMLEKKTEEKENAFQKLMKESKEKELENQRLGEENSKITKIIEELQKKYDESIYTIQLLKPNITQRAANKCIVISRLKGKMRFTKCDKTYAQTCIAKLEQIGPECEVIKMILYIESSFDMINRIREHLDKINISYNANIKYIQLTCAVDEQMVLQAVEDALGYYRV